MKHNTLRKLSLSLEKIMRSKGITPKELAQKSKIGYSSLIPIINGSRDFGVTKFIAIANALDCTADTLLNELITAKYNSLQNDSVLVSAKSKYLVVFISLISVTYCLIYDVKTKNKKTTVFQFALGCGLSAREFLDRVVTSVQAVILKNFNEGVHNKDIAVYVSVQQYEWASNRTKIQESGDSQFAKFIIESDAISGYRTLFGNKNGILIIISDGNRITYSADNGKKIIKLQGYGFPISDVAGNYWIGCEAIKHVINVKDGIVASSVLSDRILALFNDDIYYLSESIMREPDETYAKASSVVRELVSDDLNSQEIVKHSAKLLYSRVQQLDSRIKMKLPIVLAGDLANLYKPFFPKDRLLSFKDKTSALLMSYGLSVLQKAVQNNEMSKV